MGLSTTGTEKSQQAKAKVSLTQMEMYVHTVCYVPTAFQHSSVCFIDCNQKTKKPKACDPEF